MKSLADAPNAYVTPYIASTQRLYNAYNFADSARFYHSSALSHAFHTHQTA